MKVNVADLLIIYLSVQFKENGTDNNSCLVENYSTVACALTDNRK